MEIRKKFIHHQRINPPITNLIANSDDDIEEVDEIDVKFDVEHITPEQGAEINKIGTKFNITTGVFLKLLRLDYREQT